MKSYQALPAGINSIKISHDNAGVVRIGADTTTLKDEGPFGQVGRQTATIKAKACLHGGFKRVKN
jgi:hypothetical protein